MRLGGGRGEDGRKRCVGYFRRWLRASLARIIKITTEKNTNFYFSYSFFYTHSNRFSILLSIFFKYYFV
jgi:hypothetical protein